MSTGVRLLATAGIILLYRYSMQLSTPRHDWWYVVEYSHRTGRLVKRVYAMVRVWLISLIQFVPSSAIERSWLALRDGLRAGRYGEAGT